MTEEDKKTVDALVKAIKLPEQVFTMNPESGCFDIRLVPGVRPEHEGRRWDYNGRFKGKTIRYGKLSSAVQSGLSDRNIWCHDPNACEWVRGGPHTEPRNVPCPRCAMNFYGLWTYWGGAKEDEFIDMGLFQGFANKDRMKDEVLSIKKHH